MLLTAHPWTELEVEATVADYFAMLKNELRGEAYNKSEHRRGSTGRSRRHVRFIRRSTWPCRSRGRDSALRVLVGVEQSNERCLGFDSELEFA